MKINLNEKNLLKQLIENSNQTNVKIANKIGITPQAIGKIKKKLEKEGIIRGYSTDINMSYIGLNIFAIALFAYSPELTIEEREKDRDLCSRKPNIISYCKIPEEDVSHIVTYGFKDINDMENYFQKLRGETQNKSTLKRLYIFSGKGFVKNSARDLLIKLLG